MMAAQTVSRRAASMLCSGSLCHAALRTHAAPPSTLPPIYHQSAAFSSGSQIGLHRLQRSVRRAPAVRGMATASMVDIVKQKNADNPVIVYSKTWCPYCAQVKELFSQLEVPAKVVELDQVVEGVEVQDALFDISASRTVPQVFINGQFVGGADDTLMEENSGALQKRLEEIGITPKKL